MSLQSFAVVGLKALFFIRGGNPPNQDYISLEWLNTSASISPTSAGCSPGFFSPLLPGIAPTGAGPPCYVAVEHRRLVRLFSERAVAKWLCLRVFAVCALGEFISHSGFAADILWI